VWASFATMLASLYHQYRAYIPYFLDQNQQVIFVSAFQYSGLYLRASCIK